MHGDYARQPDLLPSVFRLLETVFPGITGSADRIRGLGGSWEACSTPFVHWEDGQCLSHVGLIPLPLWIDGSPVAAATLHAVATLPAVRGQGLYRGVMQELLAWADARYRTLVLTTEHPEYFTAFGFREAAEAAFGLEVDHGGGGRLVQLDPADAGQLALLLRLLDSRAPVSEVLGSGPERAVFLFNESRGPLWYSDPLDAVLVLERQGTTVRLLDVVAPVIPRWQDLLACLPWPVERVVFEFSPDRFGVDARVEPRLFEHDGPSWLMVRGHWLPADRPASLPRSSRT